MDLAAHIDHTLLKPTATLEEVAKAAEEALEYGFYGLCIPPSYVAWVRARYPHAPFRLVTVVGFPLGYQEKEVKALEAALAAFQEALRLYPPTWAGPRRGTWTTWRPRCGPCGRPFPKRCSR